MKTLATVFLLILFSSIQAQVFNTVQDTLTDDFTQSVTSPKLTVQTSEGFQLVSTKLTGTKSLYCHLLGSIDGNNFVVISDIVSLASDSVSSYVWNVLLDWPTRILCTCVGSGTQSTLIQGYLRARQ